LAFVFVTSGLGGFFQANVQEWAKAKGQDQYLVKFAELAVNWLAAVSQSAWFQATAAFFIGGAIFLWTEHWVRAWVNKVPQPRLDELAEARKVQSPPSVAPIPQGSQLQRAIAAFLAKHGKATEYNPTLIQIRDAKDGKGDYIAYWDASLWPWPSNTISDGFTADQLRMLPAVFPTLKTQDAKEKLGTALTKLSDFINTQAERMVSKSEAVRAERAPQIPMINQRGYWDKPLEEMEEVATQWIKVDKFFQEQPLLKEYPLFRAEIASTLPASSDQQRWMNSFREAVISYRDFAKLMKAAEDYENNGPLVQATPFVFAPIYQNLTKANSDLRDWITDCNRRIDMMMRAI
jgi:hypothetical protein